MGQDETSKPTNYLSKTSSTDGVVGHSVAPVSSFTGGGQVAPDTTATAAEAAADDALDYVQNFSFNLPLLSKKRLYNTFCIDDVRAASEDKRRGDKRSSSEAKASFTSTRCKRSTANIAQTSATTTTTTTTKTKCEDDSESLSDKKGKSSFSPRLEAHDEVVARESSHQFIPSTPTSPMQSSPTEPDSERSINELEELILSQIFSSSESPEELKSASSTSSTEIVPYSPLSPKLDLKWSSSSSNKELTELDMKIVDWVTKTNPIMEQWEIYFLIREHTGYPYHSLSMMQRLNEIYFGRTTASVLLRNCQIYDRSRRIKNRLTTLDKMPEVEDAHFSVDMMNICDEQCLVSQDADRVLAWIEPIRG
ncbi:hypothetical protein EPUL_005938, partial [Erysiphe pulchra]